MSKNILSKKILDSRASTLLAVVCIAALGLAGCSQPESGGSAESSREAGSAGPTQGTTSGETTAREAPGPAAGGETSAGRQTKGNSGYGGPGIEGVELDLGGEPGLEFSGRCTVDGEEHKLEGKTPATYTYSPERRLECEISSPGGGQLRVGFSDETGASSTQQVGPSPASMRLVYDGNGLSLTTSSRSSQTSGAGVSSGKSSSQSSSQSFSRGSPGENSGSE